MPETAGGLYSLDFLVRQIDAGRRVFWEHTKWEEAKKIASGTFCKEEIAVWKGKKNGRLLYGCASALLLISCHVIE
ncbi:hypothetical protein MUO32_17610 [Shinella sp. CPCC 101442]|uniref:hypothetical protein n=1 Tax=Shinella sp. CPCC 101442 TaxID=2932265 RepID=UPI0021526AD4|nr:hypothetical protein [Shinella sp. CPCC 101442]MCR6500861.1 hypothetical protein [Shinella sp. CPCC 101442]